MEAQLSNLEGSLKRLEKTLHSEVKINDERTSSVSDLDKKIKKYKELGVTIELQAESVADAKNFYKTKNKQIKKINSSLSNRFVNLFTKERRQLKSELRSVEKTLSERVDTLNKSIHSKEKVAKKISKILPIITDHCAQVSNQFIKFYAEKMNDFDQLKKEVASVSSQTKFTQELDQGKADKLIGLEKKIQAMESRYEDKETELNYKVRVYQKFENKYLTKNKQKNFVELSTTAQSLSNKEKEMQAKDKNKNLSKPNLKKTSIESEI